MVIMWFSGLRGAIAYALSLHLGKKQAYKNKDQFTKTPLKFLYHKALLFSKYSCAIVPIYNFASFSLEFKEETRKVLVTTTLVVVLFTTIILGGGTMPLMKYLERSQRSAPRRSRRRRKKEITMSKTREVCKFYNMYMTPRSKI